MIRSATCEDVLEVVADHHHAQPLVLESLDQAEHLGCLLDTERGCRLVEEHHLRLADQRARDRHRLALAAGEAAHLGPDAAQRRHRQVAQKLLGALLHVHLVDHVNRDAVHELLAEEKIRDHVEVVAQRQILKDGGDAEALRRLGCADPDLLAAEVGLTGVRGLDAVDGLDQGALAGAVVADQGDDLARVDLEVDLVEGPNGPEALGEPRSARRCSVAAPLPSPFDFASPRAIRGLILLLHLA